jgi:hypothetical protein
MTFRSSSARIRPCLNYAVLVAALLTAAPIVAGPSDSALAQRSAAPQTRPQPGSGQLPPRSGPNPQSPQAAPSQQLQRDPEQARADGSVSAEFRTALEPYGRWQHHARFGEVWVPSDRGRDWRPYTVGRWVYSEDWGWYWVEDREEADWGWITFHYGRWIDDDDLGWAWIAGEEWGPGFVQWRHGKEYVGWAPLPPEEIIVEYRDKPDVWIFVRVRDFVAARRLVAVILPPREYSVLVRETVVVNQTVILREGGRFAVNPGIPPTVIAAMVGQPIRTYDVRPRVLAGTAQIPGAIEVRAEEFRSGRIAAEATVRETRNEIRPTGRTPQLQPLASGEQGRLGDNPPRAVQRLGQQQGQQPSQQLQRQQGQQQTPSQREQQGRGKQEPAQTQGRGSDEQRQQAQQPQPQQGRQQTPQQREQQGRGKQEPVQTEGARAPVQTQRQGSQGREGSQRRQGTEGRGGVDSQRPLTEQRRGSEPQRQQSQPERSGAREQRPEQGTIGRGGGATEQARPQERSQPTATEGRGGRGGSGPVQTAPRAAPQERGQGGGIEGRGGLGPR